MSKKLYLQGGLSVTTKGKREFEVNGQTVGECLNQFLSLIPKMKEILFFESGDELLLRSNIEVRINKSANAEGLAKTVKDGDEIYIRKNNQ